MALRQGRSTKEKCRTDTLGRVSLDDTVFLGLSCQRLAIDQMRHCSIGGEAVRWKTKNKTSRAAKSTDA